MTGMLNLQLTNLMYIHLHCVVPENDCPHSPYRGFISIFPPIWNFYFSFIFSFEIPSPLEFLVTLGEVGRDLFWNYVRQYTFQQKELTKTDTAEEGLRHLASVNGMRRREFGTPWKKVYGDRCGMPTLSLRSLQANFNFNFL